MKRKMTLAFKMQAIRMYKGGMSARQVGAALSIDHCRVLTWVERFDHFGIQGISNRQPSIPLSTEEKLEIIRDIEKINYLCAKLV